MACDFPYNCVDFDYELLHPIYLLTFIHREVPNVIAYLGFYAQFNMHVAIMSVNIIRHYRLRAGFTKL